MYKVMTKRKGGKNWLPVKNDDYSRIKYFKSKKSAQKYASYLTSFNTRVIKTKKRK